MNTTYYNWHKSFTLITKRVATSVTSTKYCSSTCLSPRGDTQVSLVICRQGRAAWNVCEPHERCLLVHGWANRGLTHSAGHALSGITNLINGKHISTEPEPETVADGSFTCWCWCWWMFWSTPAAALALALYLFLSPCAHYFYRYSICSYCCLGYAAAGITLGFNLFIEIANR